MVGGLAALRHRQHPRDGAAMAANHQLALGCHQLVEAADIGAHISDTELLHDTKPIALQISLVQHTRARTACCRWELDALLNHPHLALQRIRLGRSEKSQLLLGLRGVGKTVLLNRIAEQAEALGYEQAQLEAPEGRPLVSYLAPPLKTMPMFDTFMRRAMD